MKQDDAPESGLAARIRTVRRERGLSQERLASAVGVSRSAVAQWETGRSGQLGVHLARVASVLGVGVGWLLQGGGLDDPDGALTGDQLALLRLYRACSPDDRQILLRMALRLSSRASESFTKT